MAPDEKQVMKEEKEMSKGKGKLSSIQKVAYGSGNFATNLMNCTVGTFISFYYTEVAGLPIASVGVILLVCRLLDGVSDLVMGAIVQRTRTKYGKARPWILWMAIPFGISVFLMFFSPNFGTTGKIVYAAATYMAGIAIVYTMISVPYNTLSALITNDPDERTSLATMRQFFGFMGPLFVTTFTLPIVNKLGGGQSGWSIMAAIYGILGAILYLWVFFSTKELDAEEQAAEAVQEAKNENVPKESLWTSIKALFKNKYWLIVLLITLVIFMTYGIKGGVQTYYCKYVMGNENYYSYMAMASQIPNIICCFFIPSLAKKYGKRNVSLAGCVIAVLGGLIMLIDPKSLTVLVVSTVVNTIGTAPISICVFAMLGDTAAYGEWKTGVKNEALVFSATTFSEKVGNALGGALIAFILSFGGFISGQAIQSESAIATMKICMIGAPILIAIILIVLLYFYKLDKIYPTVMKELEERQQKKEVQA